jgi:amino acid transporter
VIFVVLTGLLSAGALLVSGYGFYTPLGIWTMVLLALSIPAATKLGLRMPDTVGLLLALGLTLDGLRDSSMRKGQLRGRDSAHLENPGNLLEHSYGLLAIFALGAVILGLLTFGFSHYLGRGISALAGGSVAGVSGILRWIVWLITFIIQWFSDLFPDLPEDGPGEGLSRDIDQPVYTGGDGSWLSTVLLVILLVTLAIGLCAAAGAVLLGARKRAKKQETASDFVDEVEKLERPKGFLRRKQRGRQKLSDFRSPNMKLRFVFQQLLRKKQKTQPQAITKTPNELRDDTIQDEKTVISAYNRVKYAQGEVTPEELQAAERYLKHL